jgi:hypothetical protein
MCGRADFADFFAYNFLRATTDLEDFTEAIGDINTLRLRLVPFDPSTTLTRGPIGKRYPPLAFEGLADLGRSGLPGHLHRIRGNVWLTYDDDVRWRYVISYGGEDRWHLEGVQLGGIRSRAGVVGIWTDVGIIAFLTFFSVTEYAD